MIELLQIINNLILSGQQIDENQLREIFSPFVDGTLTHDILFDELRTYGIVLTESQEERIVRALPKFESALAITLLRLGYK